MRKKAFGGISVRRIHGGLIAVLFFFSFLALCPTIEASVTYVYTGNQLGPVAGDGFSSAFTGITGSFTVDSALPDNLPDTDITSLVTNFSFTDGLSTYSFPAQILNAFQVTTDSTGAIDGWIVELIMGPDSILTCDNYGQCSPAHDNADEGLLQCFLCLAPQYVGEVVGNPGTWSIASQAVPEPSSLLLLGTGLMTLVGALRRRNKTGSAGISSRC